MGWTNRQWDDWVRGQPGTFWGEEKIRLTKLPTDTNAVNPGREGTPSSGDGGPVGFLLAVFVTVSVVVGLGAWVLGHPRPVEVGLAGGAFALKAVATLVAVFAIQTWLLFNEVWFLMSWVASLGLLGWLTQQSPLTLAVMAAFTLGAALLAARTFQWLATSAPRAVRIGVVACLCGLALLFWLPTHIVSSIQAWRSLHEYASWMLIV